MKTLLTLLAALLLPSFILLTACSSSPAQEQDSDELVRHIVAFQYKDDASTEDIQQVTDEFRALEDKIPGIVDFETGTNNSPEGQNKGFTHVYLMTFESEEARDEYLPHPEHEAFGEMLGELDVLEDVFVIDYVPE